MGGRGFDVFSRAYRLAGARSYRRFLADLAAPRPAQDRLLRELVIGLSATEYGQRHRVSRDDRYEELARKVPIVDYEQLSPWIVRQQRSGRPVLCPGGAAFYERTSGSSGPSKVIPYTAALRKSFARMFLLWAYDTFEHGPPLRSGSTFISVSPNLSPPTPPDDKGPVGLRDDRDYLSPVLRWLCGRFLVLPRGLRQVTDPTAFKRILATYLLTEGALEVISVWNPTYLSSLLEFIETNRTLVADDLRGGRIDAGGRVFQLPAASAARRRWCAQALARETVDFSAIWPHVRLMSCWTDGNAALVLDPLRRRFPHVAVQGKGLVATEAPITIPLWHASAPVPLIGEVFFEFAGGDGEVRRLHELELGARYDLIVSQRGGLTRYRMGDRIEVVDRFRATPALRFVGRSAHVSDLVGEKLNETFVREALNGHPALAQARWMLLPVVAEGRARYVCLVDGERPAGGLGGTIDDTLQQAHQYRLARQLGQLAAVSVEQHTDLDEAYLAWSARQGRTWGNVKPCALLSSVDRAASFRRYLQARSTPSRESYGPGA